MVRLVALPLFACSAAAADYDHNLAARLVHYSASTYCASQSCIQDWSCLPCQSVSDFQFSTQIRGASTDATAIVGYDPTLKAQIVAFMGTNANYETWIDDVNILPSACYRDVGCDACNCHPGFLNTYESINSQVIVALQNLPPGKLIITGHSLGAAQATHCAVHLHFHGLKVDHVYTVGQPRLGNSAWSDWYDSLGLDHWRVTHKRDPVPHLPWRGLGNYQQILKEAYYEDATAEMPTQLCPNAREDKLCADQFNDELTVLSITDHWYYFDVSFASTVLRCTFGEEESVNVTVV